MCYNVEAVWQQHMFGGIAQLGERLNGIQEVSGSIPLISTNTNPWKPSVSKDFFISGGNRAQRGGKLLTTFLTTLSHFCDSKNGINTVVLGLRFDYN